MRTHTHLKHATALLLSCILAACSNNPKVVEPTLGAAAMSPAQSGIVDTPRGPSLTLDNVLFDFEQSTLRHEASGTVSKAVAYLNANPESTALVEGHTDVTGNEQYNQALSVQRSEAVKNALVDQGISVSRIKTVGLGETNPIADNSNLTGRQKNRRVEIIFQ